MSSSAQVPESVIERIVELRVQREQNIQLGLEHRIDPRTSALRSRGINAELSALQEPIWHLPWEVQRQVMGRISALTKARLETAMPRRQAPDPPLRQQPPGVKRPDGRDIPQHRAPQQPHANKHPPLPPSVSRHQPAVPPPVVPHAPKPPANIPQPQPAYGGGGLGWQAWLPSQIPWWLLRRAFYPGAIGAILLFLRWVPNRAMRQPVGRVKRILGALVRWRRWFYGLVLVLLWCWIAPPNHDPYEFIFRFGIVMGAFGLIALLRWISESISGWISAHTDQESAPPLSDTYGTARYANLQGYLWSDADYVSEGVFLGKSSIPSWRWVRIDAAGVPICTTPEHHTLIVAQTRTGKGTRVIVPTLLRYAGSALVIDPKGENTAITASIRKNHLSQDVHLLNPWNELAAHFEERGLQSATYNPLDILDRNDPNAVAIAQTLAGAICPMPAHNDDPFWAGNAAAILTAVFLWLADQPGERKTLRRAREIISVPKGEFEANYLTRMAASEAFSGAIRELAAPFVGMAERTYSGIMTNLSESTRFLSDPQIKTATETSSFSMQDLATKNTTVYVVIPTDRMDTQKTWLRLVIASALHIFKHPDTKLRSRRHRCLFLIDEFPALGRLNEMPRDIATMSGFGVDFALVVQDLGQIKDHYGEARSEIINNCAYKWFCNIGDLESAKYLSESLGKETVHTVSESSSTGHGGSKTASTSYGETGRSLLTPDEVMHLGRDVAIALQPDDRPHYLRPIDYWNLPNAFSLVKQRCPQLYWDPPLAYDEHPDHPGSGSAARRKTKPQPNISRVKEVTKARPQFKPVEYIKSSLRFLGGGKDKER